METLRRAMELCSIVQLPAKGYLLPVCTTVCTKNLPASAVSRPLLYRLNQDPFPA